MNKDQEIETLRQFIASVPADSYLADYFDGALEHFASMVRSDMVMPTHERVRAANSEFASIKGQIADERAKLAAAREAATTAKNDAQYALSLVRQIAAAADKAADSAADLEREANAALKSAEKLGV